MRIAFVAQALAISPMSDEAKSRLLQAGFAVPGETPVRIVKTARECTRDAPCPFDSDVAWEMLKSLALTPGPILLLMILAYSIGVQAFGSEDVDDARPLAPRTSPPPTSGAEVRSSSLTDGVVGGDEGGGVGDESNWLAKQAERSKARRIERLRDLAKRIQPVQEITGWQLISTDGLPTLDAWVFLALAIIAQLVVADALFQPIRDAFS